MEVLAYFWWIFQKLPKLVLIRSFLSQNRQNLTQKCPISDWIHDYLPIKLAKNCKHVIQNTHRWISFSKISTRNRTQALRISRPSYRPVSTYTAAVESMYCGLGFLMLYVVLSCFCAIRSASTWNIRGVTISKTGKRQRSHQNFQADPQEPCVNKTGLALDKFC